MRRYHIASHLFLFVPKMEARPRSLATGQYCIWIAIALDYVICRPRSQSPRDQVMHDKHHAQYRMVATAAHESFL